MKERRITMTEVKPDVSVRPLREGDLSEADRIMRLAFGTFLGLPDPMTFMGDAGYVRTRWVAAPDAAFGAEVDGELVGSNFATNWGSVGFFGPLTVHPDLWNKGIGSRLMEPIEECFATWGPRHMGLFTWSHSPSHIHLYEKFGFWARFLTAIMSKSIRQRLLEGVDEPPSHWSRFSTLSDGDKEEVIEACRELTNTIYDGLDLAGEIRAIDTQGLGDTLLLWDDARLVGFAACHVGAGTEAGSGACYIKFGVIRPGNNAGENFERLLDACEALAATLGAQLITAGANMGRHEAYRAMRKLGFRTDIQGVAMQRSNDPGYHVPGVYIIDDWR
jgi:GNAT superfamily N-acetyltransferase